MGLNALGLMAIVPVAGLLALSFIVLALREKSEAKNLKTFGLISVVLLWLAAAIIACGGLFILCSPQGHMMGKMGCMGMMHEKMGMMGDKHCMMMPGEEKTDMKDMKGMMHEREMMPPKGK